MTNGSVFSGFQKLFHLPKYAIHQPPMVARASTNIHEYKVEVLIIPRRISASTRGYLPKKDWGTFGVYDCHGMIYCHNYMGPGLSTYKSRATWLQSSLPGIFESLKSLFMRVWINKGIPRPIEFEGLILSFFALMAGKSNRHRDFRLRGRPHQGTIVVHESKSRRKSRGYHTGVPSQ